MKRSVALETTWFVVLTILLVVLVEVFSQHYLTSHNQDMAESHARTDLNTYALALQRQIGFYQRLLERIARREDVQNLLEIGSQNEAFLWALGYRKLLPDTIGLSLVSQNGEIQGNPDSLLIGPKCRLDIADLSRGVAIAEPAVHRERAGLEHFDLFVAVRNVEGEPLGYLFASIRLAVIQDLVDAIIQDGHKLTVLDAEGVPVASSDHTRAQADETFTTTLQVADSDWQMALVSRPDGMDTTANTLLIATSVLALFVGISVVLLSRHLSRGLLQEISSIRGALERIAEGSDKPVEIQAHFRETAPLMDAVRDVSGRIQNQQETLRQLSETDSLTGLLNRRRFVQELNRAWSLADRGAAVYVMALDIDGFKQVNDRYGHAAGDRVLEAFAGCLTECSRDSDVIARLGGDEFVVLLFNGDEAAGLELFRRLRECFEAALDALPGIDSSYCTLSAGLVGIDPASDRDADATLRRADDALYHAKHTGKNRIKLTGTDS